MCTKERAQTGVESRIQRYDSEARKSQILGVNSEDINGRRSDLIWVKKWLQIFIGSARDIKKIGEKKW